MTQNFMGEQSMTENGSSIPWHKKAYKVYTVNVILLTIILCSNCNDILI